MSFSSTEKINNSDKLPLQITGTANAPAGEKFWYNEQIAWIPEVPAEKVLVELSTIPGAIDETAADAAVTAYPLILEKRIIRLTLDPTSNNRAFEARQTFNDRSTDFFDNWIQPSMINLSGGMSPGYSIRLYNGDPAGAGTEIFTTQWSGAGGAPSWQFSYSSGLITVSTDQSANYIGIYNGAGLWVQGYRYIGETGGGGGGGGLITTITQANTFNQGQPVYLDSGTGLWTLAQANHDDTMGVALVDSPTLSSFNAIYGGAITGLSGLVPGEYYWVDSAVAGGLTSTKPAIWHNPLLHAETTTGGMVLPYRPSKDEASAGGGTLILDDRTLTSSGPILDTDSVIFLDGTSNSVSAQLPDSTLVENKVFYCVAINITNTCDITMTGTNKLSGQNGYTFAQAWERIQIYCDRSNYIII